MDDHLRFSVIEKDKDGTLEVIAKFEHGVDARLFARLISGHMGGSFFVTIHGDTGSTWEGGQRIS